MRIFLTGGAGDLGQVLCRSITGMGKTPVVFDVRDSSDRTSEAEEFICGSILERGQVRDALESIDLVVHIAAWHGIHEFKKEKTDWEFFDLNVAGTFNVFQSCLEAGIKKVVFISSTSVDDRFGIYGQTKVIGEELATYFANRHDMEIIILRPRAFIPPYNKEVYSEFIEWAKWFSKGAVHISDVAQAVIKSIELLIDDSRKAMSFPLTFTVDGAYEYTDEDLASWDKDGAGTTFKKYYGQFYDLAVNSGLDPTLKPTKLDISETRRVLNYRPLYSMKTLLLELKMYGVKGPYCKTGMEN